MYVHTSDGRKVVGLFHGVSRPPGTSSSHEDLRFPKVAKRGQAPGTYSSRPLLCHICECSNGQSNWCGQGQIQEVERETLTWWEERWNHIARRPQTGREGFVAGVWVFHFVCLFVFATYLQSSFASGRISYKKCIWLPWEWAWKTFNHRNIIDPRCQLLGSETHCYICHEAMCPWLGMAEIKAPSGVMTAEFGFRSSTLDEPSMSSMAC